MYGSGVSIMAMINHRVVYNVPETLPQHEAYRYLWTIEKNKNVKQYRGWRSRPWDGSYLHSSECVSFLEDMKTADKVEFILEDWGYKVDMATTENELLQDVNAATMDDWYNQSNGGGLYSHSDRPAKSLLEMVNSGVFDQYVLDVPCSELLELSKESRLQVRLFDDSNHSLSIEKRVNKELGNTDHLLVHVFKDYFGKGKHLLVNGGHTVDGVSKSKYPNAKIKVMHIPKFAWSRLSKRNQRLFGLMLNPREKFQRKETQLEDVQKEIYQAKVKDNIPCDAKVYLTTFSTEPFWLSEDEIKKCADNAQKEYNRKDYKISGQKYKSSEKCQKEAIAKVEELNENPNTIAVSFSTGNFKIGWVLGKLELGLLEKPKATEFVWVIYHPIPGTNDPISQWTEKKKTKENEIVIKNTIEKRIGILTKEIVIEPFEDDGSELLKEGENT